MAYRSVNKNNLKLQASEENIAGGKQGWARKFRRIRRRERGLRGGGGNGGILPVAVAVVVCVLASH